MFKIKSSNIATSCVFKLLSVSQRVKDEGCGECKSGCCIVPILNVWRVIKLLHKTDNNLGFQPDSTIPTAWKLSTSGAFFDPYFPGYRDLPSLSPNSDWTCENANQTELCVCGFFPAVPVYKLNM